jgi:hypothetical protein
MIGTVVLARQLSSPRDLRPISKPQRVARTPDGYEGGTGKDLSDQTVFPRRKRTDSCHGTTLHEILSHSLGLPGQRFFFVRLDTYRLCC